MVIIYGIGEIGGCFVVVLKFFGVWVMGVFKSGNEKLLFD